MAVFAILCASGGEYVSRAQPVADARYEVESISFEGNSTLESNDLGMHIATRETPGFFNKFLYNLNDRLGRKPEFFNPILFNEDVAKLRLHYEGNGFSHVRIDTVLTFDPEDMSVDIRFLIAEGPRSMIDSIAYLGLDSLPEAVRNSLVGGHLIANGDPYNRALLEQEVARVRLDLWNAGYPNAVFVRDSSAAMRYASTNNYVVLMAFDPGKRYKFGNIAISQEAEIPRADITDDIIRVQLDFERGDTYSEQARKESERNLNRLGIFDQARIEVKVPPNRDSSNEVTSKVIVRPRDKHELAPEIILSDENKSFNLGTGIGYTNRNFLGGARTFSTRLRFRTQTLDAFPGYFDANSDAVSNVDLTFEMLQPYILTNKIRGSWTFSLILDKQKPYLQRIIRNKFGFTDRFAEFTNGFLDWTLEGIALEKNDNFRADTTDPRVQRDLRLLEEQEKATQFNSILSFTIERDKSNDLFSPSAGFIHSATIEESGVLPLLLKNSVNLPFTQFYRFSAVGRWYIDLTNHRFSILALKLRGGFEEKYGESRSNPSRGIPQAHRFYAGGGGSVRGWTSRSLSATGDPQLGGNLLFEGALEIRNNPLQALRDDFFDNIWVVGFLDFGNIWGEVSDFQVRDVAIAAGVGFRYETFFGPFRLDYGFRVYNPTAARGNMWITQRRFFGETFSEGVFHFGIGHSF